MTTHPVQPTTTAPVACLVLAHNDPVQVRRLRAALEPLPTYVHVDRRTPAETAAEITAGLPSERVIGPRFPCGWAEIGLVEAELAGYRQILAGSAVRHVIVMSGADYPLVPVSSIVDRLAAAGERSIARWWSLPFPAWGRSGGMARLRYRHWAWRKHMLRLPIPRRIPSGIVPSGGSVWKILSRRHIEALLAAVDTRPELLGFWRRTWCSDETFVPTVLRSPFSGIDWDAESITGEAWWIGWDGTPRKSPPWLTEEHFETVRAAAAGSDRPVPALFARKVSTALSTALLDRIDRELRASRPDLERTHQHAAEVAR